MTQEMKTLLTVHRHVGVLMLAVGLLLTFGMAVQPVAASSSVGGSGGSISCAMDESGLAGGSTSVTNGETTIYVGYHQISGNNQNPIIARYDGGTRVWCRDDIETTGDDGRAYGIYFDGTTLYAAFSATGTQGSSSEDYRRFTSGGWLTSYGSGGGARVAIILRIDPATGEPNAGTFLTARLSSGNSNSLAVTDLAITERGTLLVTANSWFSPRNIDKSAMTCSGDSPFNYTIEFSADLTAAIGAAADGCVSTSPAPGAPAAVSVGYPTNGTTISAANGVNWGRLQWAHSSDFTWYHVYMIRPNGPGYDNWFSAAEHCSGETCTLDLHLQMLTNGNYQWWIQGYTTVLGSWSEGVNFEVDIAQPSPPANLALSADGLLTWDNDPGAGYYQVWVGTTDYSTTYVYEWYRSVNICTGATCTVRVLGAVEATHEAWVQAWGPGGYNDGNANNWAGPARVGDG